MGKNYQDVVYCHVVKMVLVIGPWQFDTNGIHKGKQNCYDFTWKDKKIALLPTVTPINPQPKLKKNKRSC